MTFKDDSFKFYQLPYRHNERNYARYIINNQYINFEENYYFAYLISTPYKTIYNKSKNNYSIKVAILIQNKKTKKSSLEFEEFDFESFLHLNMFSSINKTGDVTLFEELGKKFSPCISETEVFITDTQNYEILSIQEVARRFNILNKCNIELHDNFKNLEFYLYKINNQQILIPAMEIMKYFYLYDYQGNLKSHFTKNILTPNGIEDSFNYLHISGSKYDFEISGDYNITDRYKILFFITNKIRLSMYSSIYRTFSTENKISVKIPRKELHIKVRACTYKDKNLLLILNILKHDYTQSKEFPNDFSYNYKHAKSKFREEDKGLRDVSKDIKKTKASNNNLNMNDELYGNNKLEYDDETLDSFKYNIEKIEIDVEFKLNGSKEITDKRKQQGSKTTFDISNNTPMTTKGTLGEKENAVSEYYKEVEEEKEDFKITINEILRYTKNEKDFSIIEHKNFIYPEVVDDKGKPKKTSFMFIDNMKKIKRKYDIVKVKYNSYFLYIVKLQSKLNGATKSILTLIYKTDYKDINFINSNYIKKDLSEFITDKDKSWLTGKITINENNYFTFKPSGSMKGYTSKLKKHIDKYLKDD